MLLQMSDDAARLRFMLDKSKAVELAAVLDWYREMGAEEPIGEAPIDWLQRGDVAPGTGFASLLLRQSPPGAPAKAPLGAPRPPAASVPPTSLPARQLPPVPSIPASAPAPAPAPRQ